MSAERLKQHLANFVVGLAVVVSAIPRPSACNCEPLGLSLGDGIASRAIPITASARPSGNTCCTSSEDGQRHASGLCPCGAPCRCEITRQPEQSALPTFQLTSVDRGADLTSLEASTVRQDPLASLAAGLPQGNSARLVTALDRCIALSRFLL